MDASTLAEHVGTGLGGAVAAFGAMWALLVRPMKAEVGKSVDQDAVAEAVEELGRTLGERLDRLADRASALEQKHAVSDERALNAHRRLDEVAGHVHQIHQKMSSFVTDEEFQTSQNHMQGALATLTERAGKTAGAIEAWLSKRGGS